MQMQTSDEAEVRIQITEAGAENLLFRALLKRTLSLLRNPSGTSESERIALEEAYDEENRQDCSGVRIVRYGRFWAVYECENELVCLCVYKKGAKEVLGRLTSPAELQNSSLSE